MNRAQLLLIAILCVGSLRKFVGAEKVDKDHRDSHHEKDFLQQRTKRYVGSRIPLSYLSLQRNQIDDDDVGYPLDKRFSRSNSIRNNPAASHFRELQVRQRRPSPGDASISPVSPARLIPPESLMQYYARRGDNDMDLETMDIGDGPTSPQLSDVPLSDEELQALLLLLEGHAFQGKQPLTQPQNFYVPPAQYYNQEMRELSPMGKRETGKRTPTQLGLEQPMSFENSVGDNYPVFLNVKRSKRIGDSKMKTTSSVRIKKETNPNVEASLDKIFGDDPKEHVGDQHHSTSIPTTAISSSDQIPAPSSTQTKPKKAINWSDYFGIDKRQDRQHTEAKEAPLQSSSTINHHDVQHEHEGVNKQDSAKSDQTITSVSTNLENAAPASESNEKSKNAKEKKDKNKLENDTDEKADRKWILKEFYKNLAMSTNVKRKRESPNSEASKDLDKLEKIERKMEEAGDQIIWDTLKYTGAHKDAELSPEEVSHVKNQIIQKLAAAYSLEKIREAIEEFRQQLGQLKDKQQYY
ncbi:unnamed protein product [Orchesella dallaii]|uniref:Uncharacterized protein n=1 Tax=Orchesella dallaii TaxID=48710 RepID=A0ABP1QLY0_9HEXA